MRILNVISSVNPTDGGPIEFVRQLGKEAARVGHQLEIVSFDTPEDPWVQASEITVHAIGPARTSYAYAPQLVDWLKAKSSTYDATVVHGLWQFVSFGTWLAWRKTHIPYYIFTHGMLDPWFKQTYPLKHLKKSLYWPWGEYRVLRDAKGVLFTCEEERLLARQSFKRYRCREIIAPISITPPEGDPDAQRAVFFERFPALRGKRLLLFLSRVHPKKGVDLLIEAFAQVAAEPNFDDSVHLVIAGPDQVGLQKTLEAQAEQLGIANKITWAGMLSGDLKWGAFRSAEAFVLPSHQENFGIVVTEALAVGTPTLISNKVNIWREIEAGEAGIVANDTLDGTVDSLRHWLALSPQERSAMGRKAEQCFNERFEIRKAAQHLFDILQSKTK